MNKMKKTLLALSIATLATNVFAVSIAYAGNGGIAVNESGFIPPAGVSSNQSVAIGGGGAGASDNGTATGYATTAGVGATANGANTTANDGATAVGSNNFAGLNSIVVGSGSNAFQSGAVIGNGSTTGTAANAFVIGNGTTATRSNELNVSGMTIGNVGTATQPDQATNLGQVNNIANQTLSNANTYTDNKATQTLNSANQYTDQKTNQAVTTANTYTDQKSAQAVTTANNYTDNVAVQTLNSANQYTDTEIAKIKIPAGAKPVAAVDYNNTTSDDLVLNDNNGAGTRISNVADGVKDHDAANMGQLRSVQNQLNGRIDGLQRRIDGVAAMGAAQSSVVYNNGGGHVQMGLGVGFSGGAQAIAGRVMVASPSKRYIYSVGVSTSTGGQTSVGAGMSFSF